MSHLILQCAPYVYNYSKHVTGGTERVDRVRIVAGEKTDLVKMDELVDYNYHNIQAREPETFTFKDKDTSRPITVKGEGVGYWKYKEKKMENDKSWVALDTCRSAANLD